MSRIAEEKVKKVLLLREKGLSYRVISRETGISLGGIFGILRLGGVTTRPTQTQAESPAQLLAEYSERIAEVTRRYRIGYYSSFERELLCNSLVVRYSERMKNVFARLPGGDELSQISLGGMLAIHLTAMKQRQDGPDDKAFDDVLYEGFKKQFRKTLESILERHGPGTT